MEKLMRILAVVACIGLASSFIGAEVIPLEGENSIKLVSVSSHWRDGVALAPGTAPELGDELRALISLTGLHNPPTQSVAYWKSNPNEEITGLLYDLELIAFGGTGLDNEGLPQQGTTLYYGAMERNPLTTRDDMHGLPEGGGDIGGYNGASGGVTELYYDSSPDLGKLMGTDPSNWIEGDYPSRDAFPNATDGDLWLSGVFLDLQSSGVDDAPEGAVYMLHFLDKYDASGNGYINIFDGSAASVIDYSAFGPFTDATFRITVELSDVMSNWQTLNNDPIRFDVTPVPEPGTLMLLGLGATLMGAIRRRKS